MCITFYYHTDNGMRLLQFINYFKKKLIDLSDDVFVVWLFIRKYLILPNYVKGFERYDIEFMEWFKQFGHS